MSNWSDELIALTRKHVETMQGTPPGARVPLCMKHWDNRFGLLLVKDADDGRLVVADVTDGSRDEFRALDDLVAAGWVLD